MVDGRWLWGHSNSQSQLRSICCSRWSRFLSYCWFAWLRSCFGICLSGADFDAALLAAGLDPAVSASAVSVPVPIPVDENAAQLDVVDIVVPPPLAAPVLLPVPNQHQRELERLKRRIHDLKVSNKRLRSQNCRTSFYSVAPMYTWNPKSSLIICFTIRIDTSLNFWIRDTLIKSIPPGFARRV